MGESYGPFVKFLAVSTGLFAAFVAIALTVSHPWGIAGAAVIFLIWGFFLKALAFVFEPRNLRVYRGETSERKARIRTDSYAHLQPDQADPAELPDTSRIVATLKKAGSSEEDVLGEPSRILGPRHKETLWSRCYQEEPEKLRREEPKYGFE